MKRKKYYSLRMRAGRNREHISGAEGIYDKDEISTLVKEYTQRALVHDKGRAD
jgi:6-carboxyhexanoate--CoA ligase